MSRLGRSDKRWTGPRRRTPNLPRDERTLRALLVGEAEEEMALPVWQEH